MKIIPRFPRFTRRRRRHDRHQRGRQTISGNGLLLLLESTVSDGLLSSFLPHLVVWRVGVRRVRRVRRARVPRNWKLVCTRSDNMYVNVSRARSTRVFMCVCFQGLRGVLSEPLRAQANIYWIGERVVGVGGGRRRKLQRAPIMLLFFSFFFFKRLEYLS